MVEQIRISPEEVRGYGNVCEEHTLDDFTVNVSSLSKVSETVHGALTNTYKLLYSVYGLMFDFDKGAKQLYLQTNEADTLSLGFDTVNKQLYLVDENDTGFSLDFDEDTNELYITDDAPPVVHNYSLALDQSSYTTTGSLSVSATLLDDGVAVEGATVSFTGGVSTVTATTNSSGVATATVTFSASGTLTASYSNVSDTATVTVQQGYLFYDDATSDNSSQYTSYAIQGTSGIVNIAWNSTEQAYAITNNTTSGRALLQFGDTLLQNNVRISADIKLGGTSYKQNGMLAFIDKDSRTTYSVAGWVQGEKYYRLTEFSGTSELQTTTNEKWTSLSTSDYNHHELVYQNGVVTYTITTPASQTKTVSLTLQKSNYVGGKLGLFVELFSSATHCYIKNIKVESL